MAHTAPLPLEFRVYIQTLEVTLVSNKNKRGPKKKKKSPEFKANNMPFLWSYFSKILNFGLSLENKNQRHPLCTLPNMPPWGGRAYPRAARSIRRQHKGGQCQLPITGYPITQPQLGRSSAF